MEAIAITAILLASSFRFSTPPLKQKGIGRTSLFAPLKRQAAPLSGFAAEWRFVFYGSRFSPQLQDVEFVFATKHPASCCEATASFIAPFEQRAVFLF